LHLVGSRQSSADEFPRLADAMSKNDSLFRNLERDYQAELAYADEEVDATAANDRTAELLGVLHGSPLFKDTTGDFLDQQQARSLRCWHIPVGKAFSFYTAFSLGSSAEAQLLRPSKQAAGRIFSQCQTAALENVNHVH